MTPGAPHEATRTALPRVVLRKNLARAIRRGHPWIYRDALTAPEGLADGALVFVVDADRKASRAASGTRARPSPCASSRRATRRPRSGTTSTPPSTRGSARRSTAASRSSTAPRTDAFRWIHGEADRLPGIHVDLYGAVAVVRADGAGARAFYRDLPARLAAAAARARPAARRGRRARRRGRRRGWGALPDGELEVRENGVRFGVDLARGQKGGLFLDQRDNRALVAHARRGPARAQPLRLHGRVLDLRGARRRRRDDDRRRRRARHRGRAPQLRAQRPGRLLSTRAHLHAEDAFAFLERAAAAGARWDLVISDPPSFAPSERALPAALKAYTRLHRLCAAVTAPGGTLCAASCSSHVRAEAFLETVVAGARDAGRTFTLVELRGAAACHPSLPAFHEGDYLKFAHGRIS